MSPNDLVPRREAPKLPAPLGKSAWYAVVLIVLAVLVTVLWFADPAHRPAGESRVDWPPPAKTAKP
jgi:hypothetical protein